MMRLKIRVITDCKEIRKLERLYIGGKNIGE